jgi:hypothetical protein
MRLFPLLYTGEYPSNLEIKNNYSSYPSGDKTDYTTILISD